MPNDLQGKQREKNHKKFNDTYGGERNGGEVKKTPGGEKKKSKVHATFLHLTALVAFSFLGVKTRQSFIFVAVE